MGGGGTRMPQPQTPQKPRTPRGGGGWSAFGTRLASSTAALPSCVVQTRKKVSVEDLFRPRCGNYCESAHFLLLRVYPYLQSPAHSSVVSLKQPGTMSGAARGAGGPTGPQPASSPSSSSSALAPRETTYQFGARSSATTATLREIEQKGRSGTSLLVTRGHLELEAFVEPGGNSASSAISSSGPIGVYESPPATRPPVRHQHVGGCVWQRVGRGRAQRHAVHTGARRAPGFPVTSPFPHPSPSHPSLAAPS
jgi:hypothetical protein